MTEKISYGYVTRKLKEGWTLENFLEELNITESEFFESLKKILSKKAYDALARDLKKKGKVRKTAEKSIKKKIKNTQNRAKQAMEEYQQEEELAESELECLVRQESELRKKIFTNETERRSLVESRKSTKNRLMEEKVFLQKIYNEVKEHQGVVEKLVREISSLDDKILESRAQKAEMQTNLKQIQEQIHELDVAEIKILFEDGAVVSEIEIPTERWKIKFDELTSEDVVTENLQIHELAEELTVKQLKVFSKILVVVEEFCAQDRKYKLMFDRETQVADVCELLDMPVEYVA